jgi:hypothetical protein
MRDIERAYDQKQVIRSGEGGPPVQGVYPAGSDHRKDGQAVRL